MKGGPVASKSSIFDQYNSTEQIVTNRIVQNNSKESLAMSKFSCNVDNFEKRTAARYQVSGINFQALLGCRGERVQGF